MRAIDWIGVVVVGGVVIGGAVWFVRARPLSPGAPAQTGAGVPVAVNQNGFVQQQPPPPPANAPSQGVTDFLTVLGGLGSVFQGVNSFGQANGFWA